MKNYIPAIIHHATRVGVYFLIANIAIEMGRDIGGILGIVVGIILWLGMVLYFTSAMNAEHALLILEQTIGMRVQLKSFNTVNIGIDGTKFTPWLQGLATEIEAKAKAEEIRRAHLASMLQDNVIASKDDEQKAA
jgi:hypothetical protein